MDRAVRIRRLLARTLLAIGTLAIAWIGSGVLAALALTHRWRAPFAERAPDGFEAVRLRASDGIAIGAWLAEGDRDRAAIVLAHGNGSSRTSLVDEARAFRALGCTTLAISLRAHGDSEGDHNDIGWSARRDVEAAVGFLAARRDRPVALYGSSLGAAASVFAAAELGDAIDGLVLVAPYSDLRLAVRRRTTRYLWPVLDDLAYGALLVGARAVVPDLDRIVPAESARALRPDLPVLVFAGAEDDRAPVSDARAIVASLRRPRTIVVPSADHEDVGAYVTSREGIDALGTWLGEIAPEDP